MCGSETIGQTHWLSVEFNTLDIMGKVDNPIRNEIEKVAQEAGINFIISAGLNRNDQIT